MLTKKKEPIECCSKCKSLYLVNDDILNIWCGTCGHANDVEVLGDITDWLDKYGHLWNTT